MKILQQQKKYALLIILVPLAYFIVSLFGMQKHTYHMQSVDPEYAYLTNGLSLAVGIPNLGHVDHPGTTVQLAIAIAIRINHPFLSKEKIIEKVFLNPERYLKTANILIISFNTLMIFILGWKLNELNINLLACVLMQMAVFIDPLLPSLSLRVIPENMLIGLTYLYLLYAIILANKSIIKPYNAIILALIVCLGLATKITYFPFAIIGFFILRSIKNIAIYALSIIIGFPLIAFPILFRWVAFRNWVTNLLLKSGKYGTGESNIIPKDDFLNNIELIIKSNILNSSLLLFSLVLIVLGFVFRKKLYGQYRNLATGLIFVFLFQVFLVSKHYAYYYFTPAILLPLVIFIAIMIGFEKHKLSKYYKYLFIVLLFLIPIKNLPKIIHQKTSNKEVILQKTVTKEFLENTVVGNDILIVPNFYSSPFAANGLFFGNFWGGRPMMQYNKVQHNLYPNVYFYIPWHDRYYDWREPHSNAFSDIYAKNGDRLYLYFGKYDDKHLEKIFEDLKTTLGEYKKKLIFENQYTKEKIYEINSK